MIVSIIAALDEEGGIGYQNRIPWHLPGDLARFKKLTMGHHLILGRKTFQSIGRTLPGRQMIVLSRKPEYRPGGCLTALSLGDALELARARGENEAFVIGGGEVYRQALPQADRFYLTRVQASFNADTVFPEWNEEGWQEICAQEFPADALNPFRHTFYFLVRSQS